MLFAEVAMAQTEVGLHVETGDNSPVRHVEVSVLKADSVVAMVVLEKADGKIALPEDGEYTFEFDNMGYEPFITTQSVTSNSVVAAVMKEKVQSIDEVVVEGKALPKFTATGQIYTLSGKAKKSGNPFVALSEIPVLMVDIANQTVKLNTGEQPLVMIDGRMVNTGIAPIDPQFIESVEVNQLVSARYLQMGYTSMINIKLRKNRPMYLYTELRTRHDIPVKYGFGGANFEVGRKNFSIYGGVFYTYTLHDKTEYKSTERNDGLEKTYSGWEKNNLHNMNFNVTLQWQPNENNYFSVLCNPSWTHTDGSGRYSGAYTYGQTLPLSISNDSKGRTRFYNWAAYYEHVFKDKSTFFVHGIYQHSPERAWNYRTEDYGVSSTDKLDLGTRMDVCRVTADYATPGSKKRTFDFGNVVTWNRVVYDNYLYAPSLRENIYQLRNYTYASYRDSWGKFSPMFSVGLENIAVRTGGRHDSYWRPRFSTSLSYSPVNTQQLSLSYYLDNSQPSPSQLVTFNRSSDPWLHQEGNMYLKPMRIHRLSLAHNLYKGKWMMSSSLSYNQYTDMIESYIRQEGDHQVQSYRNNGSYKSFRMQWSPTFHANKIMFSTTLYTLWDRYDDTSTKNAIGMSGWVKWDFGPCYLYSTIAWRNHAYSEYSKTEYKNPITASLVLGWQITKQLSVMASLPYYWGFRKSVTTQKTGSYYSRTEVKYKSEGMHPWILFAWTIRKNAKESLRHRMPDL